MTLFCLAREGYKIKVGDLICNNLSKKWHFVKHKPRLMRVIGESGGYGIQQYVFDESGKEYDMLDFFRKEPQISVEIIDSFTSKRWFSNGKTWLEHFHRGNYGDGKQIFLGIDYMEEE